MNPNTLYGILFFHDDQDGFGAYWAFQDKRFITPNKTRFVCRKCRLCWDKALRPDGPSETATERSFRSWEEAKEERPVCPIGEHDFELICKDNWSWDGMHILCDGDELTIFDKDETNVIVWKGGIRLLKHIPSDVRVFNRKIHADQVGVDRETWARWFLDGNPATLVPAAILDSKQPVSQTHRGPVKALLNWLLTLTKRK